MDLPAMPQPLMPLLLLLLQFLENNEQHDRDLDCLELFCGQKAITLAQQKCGLKALGFDKVHSAREDFCTPAGFDAALKLMMRLRAGGCLWAAPECKTWIWLSRPQTKRSKHNVGGDISKSYVLNANRMVILLSLLFSVAYCRGIQLFMEQPSSTVLHHFEPMSTVIKHCMPHKVLTFLGKFGAESAKPILVWSSAEEVQKLKRKRPANMEKLTTRDGDRVTGIHSKLQSSQAYPTAFGEAVAEVCLLLQNKYSKVVPALESPSKSTPISMSDGKDHMGDNENFKGAHHLVY